jgi:transposase
LRLIQAIDVTRRGEVRERPELQRKRYVFISNAPDGSAQRHTVLELVHQATLRTAEAWMAREDYRAIYRLRDRTTAARFLDAWLQSYRQAKSRAVQTMIRTFHAYADTILNYFDFRITNAQTERLNGKIKQMIVNAKGFSSFEHFKNALLFYFGNLDLYPLP